jgi:hydrogenase maturation protease
MKLNETDMPRTLIIGYGNPLLGDDGVGWQVAEQLAKLTGSSANVLAVHQLTPELAELIGQADSVIFIDACYDGQPGSWCCEMIQPDPTPSQVFAHSFTPVNLLSCANALFNTRPTALLISVAASSFDCCEELSPAVAAAVPEIVSCLYEWWNANAGGGESDQKSLESKPGQPASNLSRKKSYA